MKNLFKHFRKVTRTTWLLLNKAIDQDVLLYAGFAAYNILLAFFPFIIFLMAVAGLLGNTAKMESLVTYAIKLMPPRVGEAVMPIIQEILSNQSPQLLTFSILGILWVVSSGVEGLRTGLNVVYSVEENRPYWKRRLQSIGIVLGGSLVFFILMLTIIIWPLLVSFAQNHLLFVPDHIPGLNLLRFSFVGILLIVLFSALYAILPNRKQHWRSILPGAIFSTVSWILLALLFSIYLKYFDNYNATYGSIGGLIITLVFFYYLATIVLVGGQLNIVVETEKNKFSQDIQ